MKTENMTKNTNLLNSNGAFVINGGFMQRRNDKYSVEGMKAKALYVSRHKPKPESIQKDKSLPISESKQDFIDCIKGSSIYRVASKDLSNTKKENLAGKGAVAQFLLFGSKSEPKHD